jgi:phosphate-selective porin OprO/OprP
MQMRYLQFAAIILCLLSSNVAAQSSANQSRPSQDQDPPSLQASGGGDLEARLDALERRVEQLEKRVDAALSATGAAPSPNAVATAITVAETSRLDEIEQKLQILQHNANVKQGPTVTAGRDTFSITSPDRTFRLRVGGHLQLDSKSFPDNTGHLLTDTFNIRRARPIFEGSLGNYVDFRYMPDFGNGQSLVYDAYADVKLHPSFVLRGGKFKTPLGLEVLQNDADRTFIESGLPSDLIPNRDEGFEVYGDLAHRLSYQVAVVNGAPDGANIDSSTHSGKDIVGRVFATPFATSGPAALNGLGFGIAAAGGPQDEGAALPFLRSTGGQAVFFSYGTSIVTPFADGRRVNYVPQLYYYKGPFGLMAEYASSTQKVGANVNHQLAEYNFSNRAWQVAGSWLLTGEKKSYRTVVPRRALESASNPGFGAWELVARYTELNVDPLAFASGFADPTKSARTARAWVVGANWYLNFFTKLQFEYEQTTFEQGALHGNRPTEHVIQERLQIAF